jgi:hypothetical protein
MNRVAWAAAARGYYRFHGIAHPVQGDFRWLFGMA